MSQNSSFLPLYHKTTSRKNSQNKTTKPLKRVFTRAKRLLKNLKKIKVKFSRNRSMIITFYKTIFLIIYGKYFEAILMIFYPGLGGTN